MRNFKRMIWALVIGAEHEQNVLERYLRVVHCASRYQRLNSINVTSSLKLSLLQNVFKDSIILSMIMRGD